MNIEAYDADSLRKMVRLLEYENKILKDKLKKAGISYEEVNPFEEKIDVVWRHHNMNKSDLGKTAKMSPNTIAKFVKNETVSLDILVRICEVLNCDIGDIVEVLRLDAG